NYSPSCHEHSSRRAMILIIVLVVVAMLSLGAYTFSEYMVIERGATASFGKIVQARALADSGVELAATLLAQRSDRNPETFHNHPSVFQGVMLVPGATERGQGRFSVVAPVTTDPTAQGIRFGLQDESAKLNLNTLL